MHKNKQKLYFFRRSRLFFKRNYAWLIMFPALLLLLFYAAKVEPDRLTVREVTFEHPAIDEKLDGTVIAFFADIHYTPRRVALVDRVIESIHKRNADVVLVGGDLINGGGRNRKLGIKDILQKLEDIKVPSGIYFIPGNHEYRRNFNPIRRAFAEKGKNLLLDKAEIVTNSRGGKFNLIGLDYKPNPHDRQKTERSSKLINNDLFNVALAHTPEDFPFLDKRIPLVLTGHTHGGQIHIPGLGSLIRTPWYDRKYSRGLVVENGSTLLVTTGLGSAYTEARLFTPPEIIYITLKTLRKK